MASIHREIVIEARPERVWDAVRDVGAIHERLAPGFVTDTVLEDGGAARVVTFGNGMVARELLVDCDDASAPARVVRGRRAHDAPQRVAADLRGRRGRSRAVWIADLLPHELGPRSAA
jgi:hypothetical protein